MNCINPLVFFDAYKLFQGGEKTIKIYTKKLNVQCLRTKKLPSWERSSNP